MTPCDKTSLAIGYFLIFMVIGGSIFFSLVQSQRITSDENTSWAGAFILLIFFDFLLFEFVAIIISTLLLKKVGSHPAALGPFRNFYLKYGPRLIKSAVVENEAPKTVGSAKDAAKTKLSRRNTISDAERKRLADNFLKKEISKRSISPQKIEIAEDEEYYEESEESMGSPTSIKKMAKANGK